MFNVAKGLLCNLQRPSISDYETLVHWLNDPHLQNNVFGLDQGSSEAGAIAQGWIEENTALFSAETIVLIAKHQTTDAPLGLLLFKNIDWLNRTVDIHYLIGDSKNRSGPYGPDMVMAGLLYLFHTLNFRKVHGYVYHNNKPSIGIASFAGRLEGTLKNYTYDGSNWLDYHLYAITDTDFQAFLLSQKNKVLRHHYKKGLIN